MNWNESEDYGINPQGSIRIVKFGTDRKENRRAWKKSKYIIPSKPKEQDRRLNPK
jgi:hypothetical protein